MSHDNDAIDFGAPLPPDVADGSYVASVSVKNEGKRTDGGKGKEMAFIEFLITEAVDGDDNAVGKRVSKIFMPRAKEDANFRMFQQEVKQICAALKTQAPTVSAAEVGTMAAWVPFFEAIAGESCPIWVKNKEDKTGVMRTNVYLNPPKAKATAAVADDDDERPKGKKGKK